MDIAPTYPICNQGCNPLSKWDEPPSNPTSRVYSPWTLEFVKFVLCLNFAVPFGSPRKRSFGNAVSCVLKLQMPWGRISWSWKNRPWRAQAATGNDGNQWGFQPGFFFTWSETIKIHQKKISGDYWYSWMNHRRGFDRWINGFFVGNKSLKSSGRSLHTDVGEWLDDDSTITEKSMESLSMKHMGIWFPDAPCMEYLPTFTPKITQM